MNRTPRPARTTKKASAFVLAGLAFLVTAVSFAAFEPTPPPALAQPAAGVFVPGFWDPKRRPEKPESGRLTAIRFLTEEDYPPFNFKGANGQPTGFNVDLARALCAELNLTCTIQVRKFNTLVEALDQNRGDAIIASLAITPQNRARVDFTDRYYRTPARFIARKEVLLDQITPEAIAGRRVAVVAGTAHEAYLRDFFPETVIKSYPNVETALAALKRAEVELAFGDGVTLAFWLNGTVSADCCIFRGGPFTESRYFGEGVGIAVKRGNENLRRALDYALFRVWEKGTYTDLYLRYFPISFY
ncbi:MAG TPA: transporter substrate-binding domain-containing protein [Xanthobacteraceae bacterium]|nr:transporter substrate-binding domain-containing protein [Xanthobacteraceae bacterium]